MKEFYQRQSSKIDIFGMLTLCKIILNFIFFFYRKTHESTFRNVPYCSSDLWLGKKKSNCKSNCSKDFSFMGNDILYQVIDDLLQYNSMNESEKIILSGMR